MPIDTTLTEQKIQRVLGGFIASPKYSVDGLFVFGWESDKLIWTKAGYIYEFEIKISRSDYMNDFRHKVEKHLLLNSAMQQGIPCIWYECTPDIPLVKVEILCFGTGYRMPDPGTPDGAIEHIGSVVTRDGFYVWHFYRKY